MNVALYISGMIGIILIARRIAPSLRAALVAATLYTISPMIIGQTIDVQSEALFQVSLIACTLGIFTATFPATVLAGGALGGAALTRPIALGFLPQRNGYTGALRNRTSSGQRA